MACSRPRPTAGCESSEWSAGRDSEGLPSRGGRGEPPETVTDTPQSACRQSMPVRCSTSGWMRSTSAGVNEVLVKLHHFLRSYVAMSKTRQLRIPPSIRSSSRSARQRWARSRPTGSGSRARRTSSWPADADNLTNFDLTVADGLFMEGQCDRGPTGLSRPGGLGRRSGGTRRASTVGQVRGKTQRPRLDLPMPGCTPSIRAVLTRSLRDRLVTSVMTYSRC